MTRLPRPEEIYLDHAATTPLDPRVKSAMDSYLEGGPGNPHARDNRAGWRAAEVLDQARRSVATLIGARPECLVFTSGATEADNLAILGLAAAMEDQAGPHHALYSAIEHPAVRGPIEALGRRGWQVEEIPVSPEGLVDPVEVARRIGPVTRLVSVMAANNEIGTLQPLAEIGALCRARGAVFHSDAAQAAGKVSLDVGEIGCGLMSLSAHKLYGPAGIGALFIAPGVTLAPLLHGGAQERGLRPGTVPVALAVGFAAAAEVARREMAREAQRLTAYCDRFLRRLRRARPDLKVNGTLEARLPGYLNLRFPGIQAEDLLATVPELMLATGAACASGGAGPSPVLRALGLSAEEVAESIRISLGRFTTEAELDVVLERLTAAIARLESA
jgi:cysteine desulfurase